MTRRLELCVGVLITLLIVVGCAKQVPVSPESTTMTTPTSSMPPANTPGAGQDDAARRQQELQGSVEEKERRAVEESMRRRFGDQAPQTTLTQEDFLSQDVHFAYDSYTLSDEAKSVLEQKASWMTARPDVAVQIEGHCDERGTIAYNLALGERRANTVKQYVTTLGIPSSRLTTISYGEEFPLDPKHNEEAWARNRRAHFAIINQ